MRFVYTGNVRDRDGGSTCCPCCGGPVVVRDWYVLRRYHLTDEGACRSCGTPLPGVYDGQAGRWGARRLAVAIGEPRSTSGRVNG